jgi:hypothetical protein
MTHVISIRWSRGASGRVVTLLDVRALAATYIGAAWMMSVRPGARMHLHKPVLSCLPPSKQPIYADSSNARTPTGGLVERSNSNMRTRRTHKLEHADSDSSNAQTRTCGLVQRTNLIKQDRKVVEPNLWIESRE